MPIRRTVPPAASPIYPRDILNGLRGLIRGQKEIERFRRELGHYFGAKHCFLVSSGKAALTLILQALHAMHPDRTEVLIPAFCCYSVPSAIIRAGLKIRLCDIDPATLDFDFNLLEEALSRAESGNDSATDAGHAGSKILAVIPVHLFGLNADVARARSLVNDPVVTVIEDSAQVMGAEQNGHRLGTLIDVSFFSLGRGKSFSTVEGGIVVTNNDGIAANIRTQLEGVCGYRLFEIVKLLLESIALAVFQRPSLFWFPKMLPFLKVGGTIYDPSFKIQKMSAFQSGLARNWEARLRQIRRSRRQTGAQWFAIGGGASFSSYGSIGGRPIHYVRYPIRVQELKLWQKLLEDSENRGIGIMSTYPDSINGIPELSVEFDGKTFPAARKLAGELLTVPVHPLLSPHDKNKIQSFLEGAARMMLPTIDAKAGEPQR
jgi:perosamine synthetase